MKQLLFFYSVVMFVLSTSCATHHDHHQKIIPISAERSAFEEIREKKVRRFAESEDVKARLGIRFEDLRKAKRFILFPKINHITAKNNMLDDSIDYEAPTQFSLHAKRLLKCDAFLKEAMAMKDLKASIKIFDLKARIQEVDKSCAVLVMRRIPKSGVDETYQRKAREIKEIWIYLDSDFNYYGLSVFKYLGDKGKYKEVERIDLKTSEFQHLASGLLGFPIDLPNLKKLSVQRELWRDTDFSIYDVGNLYVRNKVKEFKIQGCETATFINYRDIYGFEQRSFWCPGMPFARVIDNQKFLVFVTE